MQPSAEMTQRRYRLGETYRDKGASSDTEDQFLRWINLPKSGIRNSGGIRPLQFIPLDLPVPAYIILVTHEPSRGAASNPWEDIVDLHAGRIIYWGDAKYDTRRVEVEDFVGNRALRSAFEQVLLNNRALIPPILHFSKPKQGFVKFNGLCVIDRLELTWFEDNGRPVRNYRAHLTVLDEASVDVEWLQSRVTATSPTELLGKGPAAWRRYQAGFVDQLKIWAPNVRSLDAQLPSVGSQDAGVLDELVAMQPTQFEAAVVALFRQTESVKHAVYRTRPTRDGGFDFYGAFTLPPPLGYEIDFLGEVKRFKRGTGVAPKHVSRLVARLGRGQYGLFVTTSYFTKQAQEEVQSDRYPARLIAGADVIKMMRELRIAKGGVISPTWLKAVREEFDAGPDAA